MRASLVGVVLVFAIVFMACDPGIGMNVDNRSDSSVCVFLSGIYADGRDRPDTSDPRSCILLMPGEDTSIGTLCYGKNPKWVVLTAERREIYSRLATCGEWESSGAKVVIEGRLGSFTVTDSLPAPSPEN